MKKSTRLAELNIQLDQEEKNGGADPGHENQEAGEKGIPEHTEKNNTETSGQRTTEPEKSLPVPDRSNRTVTALAAGNIPSACTNPSLAKPAPVIGRMPECSHAKPSILTQLKQFSPPSPVSSGRQREVFER